MTTIRLPLDLYYQLEKRATADGMTFRAWLVVLLQSWLDANRTPRPTPRYVDPFAAGRYSNRVVLRRPGTDSYITLSALHDYARFRKMRLRFKIIIQAGPIRFDNERVPSRMILGTKVPATIETFHFEVSVPSDASDGDGAARTAAINRRRDQNVLPAIGYEILTLPLLDRLRPSHCTGDK